MTWWFELISPLEIESANCCSFKDTRLSVLRVTKLKSARCRRGQQEPHFSRFFVSPPEFVLARNICQNAVVGLVYPPASGQWKLAVALRTLFPLRSIFHDFCYFYPSVFVSSVSSGLRNSFISSFHLFFWWSHCSDCLVLGADRGRGSIGLNVINNAKQDGRVVGGNLAAWHVAPHQGSDMQWSKKH